MSRPNTTATAYADLFPDTLLITRCDKRIYTTSRRVAKYFCKRHGNVLRDIENLVAELTDSEFSRLNFELAEYIDGQGKPRPEYRLGHDGFALLAMGFTGREALLWKVKFLRAFRAMEAELHAIANREAAALYKVRPRWAPIARHPELPRKALISLTGHTSPDSITACRARMRQAGLL